MGASTPATLYERLLNGDFQAVEREDLTPFLPLVMRLAAERSHDIAHLRLLVRYKDASRVAAYFGLDYGAIQEAIEEELRLKAKLPDSRSAGFAVSLGDQVAVHFEAAENDLAKRVRIAVSELLSIIESLRGGRPYESEIIASPLYHRELSYILPIALLNMSVLKLQEVVRALLSLDANAAALIHAIARNMPSSLFRIASLLAESATTSSDAYAEKIKTLLLRICELTPTIASSIRTLLMEEHRTLPVVAMLITLKFTNDEVVFVNSLLGPDYGWMREYIKKLPEDAFPFRALRDKLRFHLQQTAKVNPVRALEFAQLLRIYCGLIGLANVKLNTAEMECILGAIANPHHNLRILQLGLCFVLACEGLLKACNRKPVLAALSALLESRRVTELLLLCAIHMHTSEQAAIVELVRVTLGLKVSVSLESLTALHPLFTEDLLPEAALAHEAPLLGVVPQLHASVSSLVPRCVLHLLRGRLLAKQKVDVSGWVGQQIREVAEPIHPLLPALLQEFALACFTEGWAMKPLPESDIRAVFAGTDNLAAQVLTFYWVLVHDDAAQTASEDRSKRGVKALARLYSRELTDSIPMKRLLRHAEAAPQAYAVLLPVLNSLVVAQYPQLCGLAPLLLEEEACMNVVAPPALLLDTLAASGKEEPAAGPLDSLASLLSSPFDSARTPQLALAIQALIQLKPENVALHMDSVIDSLLPALLDPTANYEVVQLFQTLWMQFYTINPWTLALRTLNLLRPAPPPGTWVAALRHSDVVSDPLIVLRSDMRVYASPPLYAILLVILNAFLTASRKQIHTFMQQPGKSSEEHTTLVLAQDAAVVQMLLEVCGRFEETRAQTCSFLHDMFIECPLLIKLVHFQTYDLALLPLTTASIASMHVCFDFLVELLMQSQPSKRIFAVHLAAELSLRYPIQKALPICRYILTFLAAQRTAPDGEQVLLQALPCLTKFCTAFPALASDAADTLYELVPQSMVGVKLQSCTPLEATVQRVFADMAQVEFAPITWSPQCHMQPAGPRATSPNKGGPSPGPLSEEERRIFDKYGQLPSRSRPNKPYPHGDSTGYQEPSSQALTSFIAQQKAKRRCLLLQALVLLYHDRRRQPPSTALISTLPTDLLVRAHIHRLLTSQKHILSFVFIRAEFGRSRAQLKAMSAFLYDNLPEVEQRMRERRSLKIAQQHTNLSDLTLITLSFVEAPRPQTSPRSDGDASSDSSSTT